MFFVFADRKMTSSLHFVFCCWKPEYLQATSQDRNEVCGNRDQNGWDQGSEGWDQGSKGWDQGSEGWDQGSEGWDQGSEGWDQGSEPRSFRSASSIKTSDRARYF